MLHHVPSSELQDRLFAEIARVLRPGAALVASDSLGSDDLAAAHDGDTYNPVDPETLPDRLAAAGFTDVDGQDQRIRLGRNRPQGLAGSRHQPAAGERPPADEDQPQHHERASGPTRCRTGPSRTASDSQISGRKPTSALTSVALRMNSASPAPSSTPSSAKTIPAIGNCATMNHHGTPIASSTERSSVNSRGNTDAPDREHHRQHHGGHRREHRHPPRHRLGVPGVAPRRAPHRPATARRSPANPAPAQGNSTAAAPPGGRRRRPHRTGRRPRPRRRSRPGTPGCAPAGRGPSPPAPAAPRCPAAAAPVLGQQRPAEQQRRPATGPPGWRPPSRPAPAAAGPASRTPAAGTAPPTPRSRRSRSAAAARCPARRASSRCRPARSGSPGHRGSRSAATAARLSAISPRDPAIAETSGTAASSTTTTINSAQPERQPGRLHALAHRRRPGRPRRRSGPSARSCRRTGTSAARTTSPRIRPPIARPASAQRTETADDGEVEQQIERFGGQHAQRGQRQRGDPAPCRVAGGAGRPTSAKSGAQRLDHVVDGPVAEYPAASRCPPPPKAVATGARSKVLARIDTDQCCGSISLNTAATSACAVVRTMSTMLSTSSDRASTHSSWATDDVDQPAAVDRVGQQLRRRTAPATASAARRTGGCRAVRG